MRNHGLFDRPNYGSFAVATKLLESMPELLQHDIFSKMLIIRAEYLIEQDAIMYTAWSKHFFQEIPEGESIPHYKMEVNNDTGEIRALRYYE
jgi:hypothetical protein